MVDMIAMRSDDLDELEWSDEEDIESRYTLKPYAPKVIDLDREILDENAYGNRLADHKRSVIFTGKIQNTPTDEMTKKTWKDSLWALCCSAGIESVGKLVPVAAIRSASFAEHLQELFSASFDKDAWRKELNGYDKDDYIEFDVLLKTVKRIFGDPIVVPAATPPPSKQSFCLCALPACSHSSCQFTSDYNKKQDFSGLREGIVCLEDEAEEDFLNSNLRFRLEVVYKRMLLELNGKIRVRHIGLILNEVGIPYDKQRLPQSFWNLRGEFMLASFDDLCSLVRQIRQADAQPPDPLDHLFHYRIPHWLREEFKVSELLLYQHHFTLTDRDGGGSIDAAELQILFSSLGSRISLEQAQILIEEYDLDGGGTVDFVEFLILVYKVQRGTLSLGEDNGLARVLNAAKAQLKIFEEIEALSRNPPCSCTVTSFGGSPVVCDVDLVGPAGSPYAGLVIPCEVVFLEGYPYYPPDVLFLRRTVSLNVLIQLDGRGRLLHLSEVWSPDWSLAHLLQHLMELLANPRPDLLPVRFMVIFDHWSKQMDLLNKKNNAELRELEEKGKAEEDLQQQEEGEDRKGEHETKKDLPEASVDGRSETKGPDSNKAVAPTINFDDITSEEMKRRILLLPRVEQMHLSLLFLFLVDPAAFVSHARLIAERFLKPA